MADEPRTAVVTGEAVGEPAERLSFVAAEPADDERANLATARWEPIGGSHRLNLRFGDSFPVGPPAAPLALRIAQLIDGEWDIGLPDLTPAGSLGQPD